MGDGASQSQASWAQNKAVSSEWPVLLDLIALLAVRLEYGMLRHTEGTILPVSHPWHHSTLHCYYSSIPPAFTPRGRGFCTIK